MGYAIISDTKVAISGPSCLPEIVCSNQFLNVLQVYMAKFPRPDRLTSSF